MLELLKRFVRYCRTPKHRFDLSVCNVDNLSVDELARNLEHSVVVFRRHGTHPIIKARLIDETYGCSFGKIYRAYVFEVTIHAKIPDVRPTYISIPDIECNHEDY